MFGVSSGFISLTVVFLAAVFVALSFLLIPLLLLISVTVGAVILTSSVMTTSVSFGTLVTSSRSQVRQRLRSLADRLQNGFFEKDDTHTVAHVLKKDDKAFAHMVVGMDSKAQNGYQVKEIHKAVDSEFADTDRIIRDGSPINFDESSVHDSAQSP